MQIDFHRWGQGSEAGHKTFPGAVFVRHVRADRIIVLHLRDAAIFTRRIFQHLNVIDHYGCACVRIGLWHRSCQVIGFCQNRLFE